MLKLLVNTRLKYKFWLVNAVSFCLVCIVVLFAMYQEYSGAQERVVSQTQASAKTAVSLMADFDKNSLIQAIKNSHNLVTLNNGGLTVADGRGPLPDYLLSDLKRFSGSVSQSLVSAPSLLALTPVYAISFEPHANTGKMVGVIAETPSWLSIFIALAPRYAVLVFVLMLVLLAASQLLILFVERYIAEFRDALVKVQEERDLTVRVPVTSDDEIGQMALAFNDMQTSRQQTMRMIANTVDVLEKSSCDLAESSEITMKGMSKQQEEAGRLVVAMTQMTAAAEEIAHRAIETHQISEEAAQRATLGRNLVEETGAAISALSEEVLGAVEKINRLNESSQSIENATDEIKGIAEQTNLLALNAAIEAARAGESGRGFAVVADEVRKLAIHAQEATEQIQSVVAEIRGATDEINQVMSNSRDKAGACVSSAQEAVNAIQDVDEIVDQVTNKNMAISAAAEEQSQTVESMSQNLNTIEAVSRETHAHAIEISEHTQKIYEQCMKLHERVSQTKVE